MYLNYDKYFHDQMVKYESFEGDLYVDGIKKTIDHIWPEETTGRLLDFCCGDGTTSKFLVEKGFDVIGFDGNENKINRAALLDIDAQFLTLEVNEIDIISNDGFFDVIYASHCFEHFLDPMKILKDCRRLLAPGGEIILVLPYPNGESDGHPGSGKLMLDKDISDIIGNFYNYGFDATCQLANFREPEIIIRLK